MAEHAGNKEAVVNPSSLLWQVACVISHSRSDLGLCPVFVEGRQCGARGIVEAWAQSADDASLEGCYLSASDQLNDILDTSLIKFILWLSTGALGIYLLQGNSAVPGPVFLIIFVAWILWFKILAESTSKAQVRDLSAILESCAIELHHRNPLWDPFIGLAWIRRRRLRKISRFFREIAKSTPNKSK